MGKVFGPEWYNNKEREAKIRYLLEKLHDPRFIPLCKSRGDDIDEYFEALDCMVELGTRNQIVLKLPGAHGDRKTFMKLLADDPRFQELLAKDPNIPRAWESARKASSDSTPSPFVSSPISATTLKPSAWRKVNDKDFCNLFDT